jgi:hypothetical protein
VTFKRAKKEFTLVFMLILFEGTLTSFFKDKKVKKKQ